MSGTKFDSLWFPSHLLHMLRSFSLNDTQEDSELGCEVCVHGHISYMMATTCSLLLWLNANFLDGNEGLQFPPLAGFSTNPWAQLTFNLIQKPKAHFRIQQSLIIYIFAYIFFLFWSEARHHLSFHHTNHSMVLQSGFYCLGTTVW